MLPIILPPADCSSGTLQDSKDIAASFPAISKMQFARSSFSISPVQAYLGRTLDSLESTIVDITIPRQQRRANSDGYLRQQMRFGQVQIDQ